GASASPGTATSDVATTGASATQQGAAAPRAGRAGEECPQCEVGEPWHEPVARGVMHEMRAPKWDATAPTRHQWVPVRKRARANAAIALRGRWCRSRIMFTLQYRRGAGWECLRSVNSGIRVMTAAYGCDFVFEI